MPIWCITVVDPAYDPMEAGNGMLYPIKNGSHEMHKERSFVSMDSRATLMILTCLRRVSRVSLMLMWYVSWQDGTTTAIQLYFLYFINQ